MKAFTFLIIAAALPLLGWFQETTVFQHGQVVFRRAFYGQVWVVALMLVAATVLFAMAWRTRTKVRESRTQQLVRFAPALFAIPAGWQNWTVSRYGAGNALTEIKTGLGGPLTIYAVLAAAVLFIAIDAYWRHTQKA